MLEIKLLGVIKISYLNMDITEKLSTKALAILSLLLLNYPRDIQREKIVSYLCPESTVKSGKYNLRYNLWSLKKFIKKDDNSNDFLKIRRNHCGINKNYNFKADIISIDSVKNLNNASIEELEFIIEKFKGDFLEGFYFKNCDDYNELIIQERIYFENKKIKVLLKLVDLYDNEKKIENCEKLLKELLKLDPYNEEIALKNMKYLDKIGEKSSAILFYNSFKNRLITSLSIQPSNELEKVYSDLIMKNIKKESRNFFKNKQDNFFRKRIEIKLEYGVSVKYFGISQVLKILAKNENINLNIFLTKEEKHDLGYINNGIFKEIILSETPDIRILNSFESMIDKLNREMNIIIIMGNNIDLDKFSIEVLKYLSNKGLIEMIIH